MPVILRHYMHQQGIQHTHDGACWLSGIFFILMGAAMLVMAVVMLMSAIREWREKK